MPATATRPLWRDPVVAAAVMVILIVQAVVVWRALPRVLDHDEGEHLRAAAWMASGKTLYRDFAENHTPFLYMILAPLAPAASEDTAATRHYTVVARALSAAAGVAAVLCIAAIAVHLTGDVLAILPVLAVLLATSWTWIRGVADVRSEPYTLLLFWAGALLVVRAASSSSRRALLAAGAGIGLIAIADLWNPKWPLESLVVLGWYAVHLYKRGTPRYLPGSLAIAGSLPCIALLIALRETTLRELFFYSFTYASAVSRWYRGAAIAVPSNGFAFCPWWLMPWAAVILAAIVIWRRRKMGFVLLLLLAAAIEVFILYPYPHLWPQYLVMWACVVGLLYGVAIQAVCNAPAVRVIVAAMIAVGFTSHDWPHVIQDIGERPWQRMAALQRLLAPGEAAWVRPEELPSAAAAGSYYWYAFDDQVPFTLGFARTAAARGFLPALGDEDLPPCRILRGIDTMHVRLLDSRAVNNLPASSQCLAELARRGAIRRVVNSPIWEVVR